MKYQTVTAASLYIFVSIEFHSSSDVRLSDMGKAFLEALLFKQLEVIGLT
jgi:hypothetical protein